MTPAAPSVGTRVSSALRARIEELGNPSAVARALLLVGLAQLGEDMAQYQAEAALVLRGISSPALRSQVQTCIFGGDRADVQQTFNVRSTNVEHAPPLPHAAPFVEDDPLAADDPFASIGFDV